ncbi:hypothetical protein F53441_6320 [Fusarium austroafricanum]|uniref:Cutinase n=1 Tax=Fusarium austroafricanum TaxID=2364996 RepID=A0A8H4NTK0_9HYPO|nr:hypothetical protein F53441_6320 [Fusarium austroafricanum]
MQRATTLLLLAAAVDAHSIGVRDDCTDVHVFLAKGNNEPYPGRQGKLAKAICDGLKSCDYEDIKFENKLEDPFCDSVTEGVQNGIKQITAYNKRCPKSKLVVSGYSQGGQVVGDILGGGGGVFFQGCVEPNMKGLDPKSAPGSSIYAAMVFGDTRHTQNQPFNVLSGADKNGLFPRPAGQLSNLAAYGNVFRNYCVKTDPICAQGKDVETHLNYFDVFTDEVAEWVKEKVKAEEETTMAKTSTKASTKTKASTTSTEDATTTSEAKETTEKQTTAVSTTKNTAASATDEASSTAQTGTATSNSEATSDAAAPPSTDNAATSKSASLMGMVMGIAALLAF